MQTISQYQKKYFKRVSLIHTRV